VLSAIPAAVPVPPDNQASPALPAHHEAGEEIPAFEAPLGPPDEAAVALAGIEGARDGEPRLRGLPERLRDDAELGGVARDPLRGRRVDLDLRPVAVLPARAAVDELPPVVGPEELARAIAKARPRPLLPPVTRAT
jgi:hypothetical protein